MVEQSLLSASIASLNLNAHIKRTLVDQTPIRSINDLLHLSEQQLEQIGYLRREDITHIVNRLEKWCANNQIDLKQYPIVTKTNHPNPRLKSLFNHTSTEPIETLELSNWTIQELHRVGVFAINDLLNLTRSELAQLPKFGPVRINDIVVTLTEYFKKQHPTESLDPSDILNPVSELKLNLRSQRVTQQWRIHTIQDLLRLSPDEILVARHVGIYTYRHLQEQLIEWGNKNNVDLIHYPIFQLINEDESE